MVASDAGDTRGSAPEAGATMTPAADAAPAPPALESPPRGSSVVLVNATTSFPAFRMCPSASATDLFSRSAAPPVPTALMPKSNLAGVDVNGAVRVDPMPALADADEVLLLKVDKTTALNPSLSAGDCIVLACEGAWPCVGKDNVVRVPVPKGSLNEKGSILVLTDSLANLRFEQLPALSTTNQKANVIDVQLVNRSATTKVVYQPSPGALEQPLQADGLSRIELGELPVATFRAGDYSATLAEIHASSDPRAPIDAFYSSPGAFALLLLGAEGGTRPLKFLAIPVGPAPAGTQRPGAQ